jgi:hypothetical protein
MNYGGILNRIFMRKAQQVNSLDSLSMDFSEVRETPCEED